MSFWLISFTKLFKVIKLKCDKLMIIEISFSFEKVFGKL